MDKIDQIYKQRSSLQDKAQELLAEFSTQENIPVEDWMALAHELFMLGLIADAITAYSKALQIAKTFTGQDRKSLMLINAELGSLYENTEDFVKAYEYWEKSYNLRVEFYGQENLYTRMLAERLKKLKVFMQYEPDEELENELKGASEHQ